METLTENTEGGSAVFSKNVPKARVSVDVCPCVSIRPAFQHILMLEPYGFQAEMTGYRAIVGEAP